MQFRDIILEQERVDREFKRATPLIPAVTCDILGNTEDSNGDPISAAVNEEPNRLWVRTFNDAVPQAVLNDNVVQAQTGLMVYIGYLEGSQEIEIIRLNRSVLSETVDTTAHSTYSETFTNIFRRQLAPLKVTPSGTTLIANIGQLEYDRNGGREFIVSTTLDLASSVPGSGLKRYTLVYLDMATGTVAALDGDTVANVAFKTAVKPDTPLDGIASVYVLLIGGATLLVEDDIEAAQRILVPNTVTGATSNIVRSNLEIPADYTMVRGTLKIVTGSVFKIINTGRVVIL